MSGRDRPGVIVGAGIAGVRCAQRVRRLGFSGRLVLVDAERALPYARPPLSKEVLAGKVDPKDRPLASARSYEEAGIELWLGRRAVGLDLDGQRLWLDRDEELAYRWIVLATGLRAASLPGGSLGAGVHTLRTGADAIALRAALRRATKVTVIGAGLIGGEVAAVARQAGLEVTILEAAEAPFARAMGTQLAGEWEALHRAHGVTVESGAAVVGVERRNGNHEIMLADGRCVTADVVVCAVGSRPNDEWLLGSGVPIYDGVVCDETLSAGAPNVWAAGDIARWPHPRGGGLHRVEHWVTAGQHGWHVARNIVHDGPPRPFTDAPMFWSEQFGCTLQLVGMPGPELEVLHGSVEDRNLVAVCGSEGRVHGVVTINNARAAQVGKQLLEADATWEATVRRLSETTPDPAAAG